MILRLDAFPFGIAPSGTLSQFSLVASLTEGGGCHTLPCFGPPLQGTPAARPAYTPSAQTKQSGSTERASSLCCCYCGSPLPSSFPEPVTGLSSRPSHGAGHPPRHGTSSASTPLQLLGAAPLILYASDTPCRRPRPGVVLFADASLLQDVDQLFSTVGVAVMSCSVGLNALPCRPYFSLLRSFCDLDRG